MPPSSAWWPGRGPRWDAPYTTNADHIFSVAGPLEICHGHGLRVGLVTLNRRFYSTAVLSFLQASGYRADAVPQ